MMRRRRHETELDVDEPFLTEDLVVRLAEELLERAYALATTEPAWPGAELTPPSDLRIVLGARDVVAWRIQQERTTADIRAYTLVDGLMPPDLRVPLALG